MQRYCPILFRISWYWQCHTALHHVARAQLTVAIDFKCNFTPKIGTVVFCLLRLKNFWRQPKIYTNVIIKPITVNIVYSEFTKQVNLPRIPISQIPTCLNLAWLKLQNLSKEYAIDPKRGSLKSKYKLS